MALRVSDLSVDELRELLHEVVEEALCTRPTKPMCECAGWRASCPPE